MRKCHICGGDHPVGIGGSSMGRILGLVPGTNALDVYHSMTRPYVDGPRTVDMFRGHELEPKIAEWYWKRTGRRGRRFSGTATHPDYPAFQCHLDLDIFSDEARPEGMRGPGVGEMKAPRSKTIQRIIDFGLRDSEIIQAQTYCAVSRRSWAGYAIGSTEHDGVYDEETDTAVLALDVLADERLGEFLLRTGQRFFDEHVVPRIPPDPAEWRALWYEGEHGEPFHPTSGELVVIEDEPDSPDHVHRMVALADKVIQVKRIRKQADEQYSETTDQLRVLVKKHAGSDRIKIPGIGKFTVVRNAGRRTISASAIEGHRPIDRDALWKWMRENTHDEFALDQDEALEAFLAELELDLATFYRQGEPFEYLLPTEET